MFTKIVIALILGAGFIAAYEICKPGESGTFHRDYSSCKSYFACVNGKSYTGTCPQDFVFNANISACDFSYNVQCDLSCPPIGKKAFLLPNSCTKYISCIRGKGEYMECLPGTLFDAKTQSCNLLEKVKCPYGGACPDPRVNNTIASTVKCDEYFQCNNGKLLKKSCDDGQHFNALKQKCDTPENAKCPIVTEKEEEMTDIDIVCPSTGSFFYPHPMNCHAYYVCHNGKVAKMSCGRVLEYDYQSQRCDLPKRAKCIVDALNQPILITPFQGNNTNSTAVIDGAAAAPTKKPKKPSPTKAFDDFYLH